MVPGVPKVPRVPGEGAIAFAARWFDPAIVARVFEPLTADWQREWQDASGLARWSAYVRGLAAFICATFVSSPRVLRQPAPSTVTNRIATRITRFTLFATILLTASWWTQYNTLGSGLLFIVPSVLVLAFPFAMIGAVDAIRGDHALPPHVERATVVKLAIASLLFMIVFGGFVVPASNQAFRKAEFTHSLRAQGMEQAVRAARMPYSREVPYRGLRERSTYELMTDHGLEGGARFLPETVRAELSNRASIAALPVLLLWLRWRLLDAPRRRWSPLPPTVVAIAAFVCVWLVRASDRIVESSLNLPAGAGAWSPIVVISVALFLDSWRRAKRGSIA